MKLIYNNIFLEHYTGPTHAENRHRLESLGDLPNTKLISGEPFLELVHTKEHIEHVKAACVNSTELDIDTKTSPKSYEVATYAVGAAIMASQTNDFAIVRPPGHHAHPTFASGFCLFNNIAIAVQKLVNEGKRVFILDFDGHLGDGTLKTFHNTDKVLFWSLHQYPAFPGGGNIDEIGEGKGKGFSINTPLPPGSADDVFMHAITNLMTIAEQFSPDVVAISAGFDAHMEDPLLQLNVSATSYYKIGELLKSKFKNVFAVLEGGYNTEYLPKCLYNFLAGINGEKIIHTEKETASNQLVISEYTNRMESLITYLHPYWQLPKSLPGIR
ncbi:MAG TPA: histone deacetylase [Bacteroidia bacterium]|nr:histone deacetylase [Bacteroidia bacterium]